nr:hypothetical protein B456_008G154200 [Ipomoea batatas]
MPLSNSAICSYFIGRRVSNSKPNFSCSVPILYSQVVLHPEARYPTRSSFVNGSAAVTTSSVGGLAATVNPPCPRLDPAPLQSKRNPCIPFDELREEEEKPKKISFLLNISILLTTLLHPPLHFTTSECMPYDGPDWDINAMLFAWIQQAESKNSRVCE